MGVDTVLLEVCVQHAQYVQDIDGFKNWTCTYIRPLIPHGALACGYGRIHSAGVAMDYVITVDYPMEHLKAICNSSGAIDTPLMRRWLLTRKPIFFDAENPWSDINPQWLEHFRRHKFVNAAADAVIDDVRCIATYFSFHRLPSLDEAALTETFEQLTPLLHETLMQAVNGHQQQMARGLHHCNPLTRREQEIAILISNGKSNGDIAALLCLSENTVKHHISRILDKTGCGNRTGLAAVIAQRDQMQMGTKVL